MRYGNIYSYKRKKRHSFNLLGAVNLIVLLLVLTLYFTDKGIILKSDTEADSKAGSIAAVKAPDTADDLEKASTQTAVAAEENKDSALPAEKAPTTKAPAAPAPVKTAPAPPESKPAKAWNIKAPFNGYIGSISVEAGQILEKGDPLFSLTDTSKVKIMLMFNSVDAENITEGQKAAVTLWDFMTTIDGTVTYINSKPVYTSVGGKVVPVEIEIRNPGAIQKGMKADARLDTPAGSIKSLGPGSFDYVNSMTVRAPASGTIENVTLRENQYVNKGDQLLSFISLMR